MSKKIIISDGKNRESKKIDTNPPIVQSVPDNSVEVHKGYEKETEPIPLDENVWGNDNVVSQHLDAKQLAERRLFVRIRHFQQAECHAISDNEEIEPEPLPNPFALIITDLSMGGIGIVCDQDIGIGKILLVRIVLDGIAYDVKCRVMYCFWNDGKFRAGLKVLRSEKQFIYHMKIYIAKKSINSAYGGQENNGNAASR